MKIRFVTADGCERIEERAMNRREPVIMVAMIPTLDLRPSSTKLMAPINRRYQYVGREFRLNASGYPEDILVYGEIL